MRAVLLLLLLAASGCAQLIGVDDDLAEGVKVRGVVYKYGLGIGSPLGNVGVEMRPIADGSVTVDSSTSDASGRYSVTSPTHSYPYPGFLYIQDEGTPTPIVNGALHFNDPYAYQLDADLTVFDEENLESLYRTGNVVAAELPQTPRPELPVVRVEVLNSSADPLNNVRVDVVRYDREVVRYTKLDTDEPTDIATSDATTANSEDGNSYAYVFGLEPGRDYTFRATYMEQDIEYGHTVFVEATSVPLVVIQLPVVGN